MRIRVLVLFSMICFPLSLSAQGFWVKKDFNEWSARECGKMLSDSPWARGQTITRVFIEEVGNPSSVPSREHAPRITYVAQIWSAEPIRQAVVRQFRLGPEFDRLSASQRQSLEAKQASLLDEKFSDRIVVRVEYSTTVPAYERALSSYWQNRTQGAWMQDTFLNASSGRHSPVGVQVERGAGNFFVLAFPREIGGKPVIGPTDKSFIVELQAPEIETLPAQRILLEFRLKNMAIKGKVVF